MVDRLLESNVLKISLNEFNLISFLPVVEVKILLASQYLQQMESQLPASDDVLCTRARVAKYAGITPSQMKASLASMRKRKFTDGDGKVKPLFSVPTDFDKHFAVILNGVFSYGSPIQLDIRLLSEFPNTGCALALYMHLLFKGELKDSYTVDVEKLAHVLFRDSKAYAASTANQKLLLNRAVVDINALTQFNLDFTAVKEGRKITQWVFSHKRSESLSDCYIWFDDCEEYVAKLFRANNLNVDVKYQRVIAYFFTHLQEMSEALPYIAELTNGLVGLRILKGDEQVAAYIMKHVITYQHKDAYPWYMQPASQALVLHLFENGALNLLDKQDFDHFCYITNHRQLVDEYHDILFGD